MTRYKITAPVPHVVSTIAGVAFADSVGETDKPAALAYFTRHGYGVEALPDPDAEPTAEESTSEPTPPADLKPPTEPTPTADGTPPELKRPAKSASKADWTAFWVAQGMTAEAVEALNRDQLAELTAVPTTPEEGQQ